MALTDAKVKNAKPGEKMYRLYDKEGLYLQVQPNGSCYWRWKYRFDCKEKVLALGVWFRKQEPFPQRSPAVVV
jgi:Arm DNA-binding domain